MSAEKSEKCKENEPDCELTSVSERSSVTEADWSKLPDVAFRKIFKNLCVDDVFFCSRVCTAWDVASQAYFEKTRCLHWSQLVHDFDSEIRVIHGQCRRRVCERCLQIFLTRIPDGKKVILVFDAVYTPGSMVQANTMEMRRMFNSEFLAEKIECVYYACTKSMRDIFGYNYRPFVPFVKIE